MPKSPLESGAAKAGMDWLGIARILALQLAVLFVLAVATVAYIDWASQAAVAEFMRSETSAAQHSLSPGQQANGGQRQCDRRKAM